MNNQSLLLIVIISVLIGILLVILYINLTIKTKRVLKAENEEAILALQRERRKVLEVSEDSEEKIYKCTVLGAETFINGELFVEDDLKILGTIKGDVTCSGKVEALGKIEGDIHANSLYVWENTISGNLYCEDLFQNAEKTIIQGNVNARNAEIEGTIEGDLVIEDTLVLGKNSVVTGNIETGEIEISRDAILCGKILIKKNSDNI